MGSTESVFFGKFPNNWDWSGASHLGAIFHEVLGCYQKVTAKRLNGIQTQQQENAAQNVPSTFSPFFFLHVDFCPESSAATSSSKKPPRSRKDTKKN